MKRNVLLIVFLCIASLVAFAQLEVQYREGDHGDAKNNAIKPQLVILNNGASGVALSSLTVRYYYSKEGKAKENWFIDYAACGNSNVKIAFGNGYLETSFTSAAGTIPARGSSGEVHIRIHKADWSDYNETNDYSYNAAYKKYTDWNKVTLYKDGVLAWGIEPQGSGPSPSSTPNPTPRPTATPVASPTALPPTECPCATPFHQAYHR
jgi:cellulose 1,4-beta-cellobiosidase